MNGRTAKKLRKFCRIQNVPYKAGKYAYHKMNTLERMQMHKAVDEILYREELRKFIKPVQKL